MYQKELNVAQEASGTLQKQQDVYMESTEAHLEQMRAAAEETYSILFDQDTARDFFDILTNGLSTINKYLNSLNTSALFGVAGQLTTLGANLLSKQIGSGIAGFINNRRIERENKEMFKSQKDYSSDDKLDLIQTFGPAGAKETLRNNNIAIREIKNTLDPAEYQKLIDAQNRIYANHLKNAEAIKNQKRVEEDLVKIDVAITTAKEKLENKQQEIDEYKKEYGAIELENLRTQKDDLDKVLEDLRHQKQDLENEQSAFYENQKNVDVEKQNQEDQELIDNAVKLGNEQMRVQNIVRGTTALIGTWNNLSASLSIIQDEDLGA